MRLLLFTGKGGVGKTTLASATAARLARGGHKALVISADPAHSLGDVLETSLDADPVDVEPGLSAAHLDHRALLESAWGELRGHLRTVLAGAGVEELVADELTWLPGVEELLALGEVRRLAETGPWDVVVVDCGPTAETLRLLGLPEAISGYLERLYPAHRRAVRGLLASIASGGQQRAGASASQDWDAAADALGRLAKQLAALRAMLTDHATTSVRLVLTPERLVAAESRRTLTALALHGLRVDGVIANRVMPAVDPAAGEEAASWWYARRAEQRQVLDELAALWSGVSAEGTQKVLEVPYAANEPIGVPALVELGETLYRDEDPLAGASAPPLLAVRRTRGTGRELDSEFELVMRLPGIERRTPLGLARIDDDLAVTVGGVRRLVALPSVLIRCEVVGARVDSDELVVLFRPDPATWMRS